MSISLYDATVTNYLQTLNSTAAVLDKGKSFCEENGIDLSTIVETRLIEDIESFPVPGDFCGASFPWGVEGIGSR